MDKIKTLLDKYYSGIISPDEYGILISALKEDESLAPELEAEKRMFLSIESCEPIVPYGFEKRLGAAIDARRLKVSRMRKMLIAGSVAATVLICMTLGWRFGDRRISYSETVAEAVICKDAEKTSRTIDELTHQKAASESGTTSIWEDEKHPVNSEMSDEEIEKAVVIIDDALLDVLSEIRMSQNNVADCLESVETTQTTDLNTF